MSDLASALTDPDAALGHLAAALLVAAMLMASMRRLRLLALGAGLVALLHVALTAPLAAMHLWLALFVLANAIQLAVLLHRSRTCDMGREERELLEHVLRVEEPTRQRRLLGLLRWRDVTAGEVLMRQGQASPPLAYIASGTAVIEHEGRQVGTCGAGDFLGEMSLVSGERATATVTAAGPMRIAVFDRDALVQLARSAPEIGHAIDGALNRGLAAKVLRMNRAVTGS
jgi:CRP-like cAMP-binding protein